MDQLFLLHTPGTSEINSDEDSLCALWCSASIKAPFEPPRALESKFRDYLSFLKANQIPIIQPISSWHAYASWQLKVRTTILPAAQHPKPKGIIVQTRNYSTKEMMNKRLEKEQIRSLITELLQHAATISGAILEDYVSVSPGGATRM